MNMKIRFALFMIVSLFAVCANGAPMAYSVNSDSMSATQDSLYLIDLETGVDLQRGQPLFNGEVSGGYRLDTEGLAFDKSGTLWGIDDISRTLFPIDTISGSLSWETEVSLRNPLHFPEGGSNDFGMTFSCDDTLYVTSLSGDSNKLYRLGLDGSSETIGTLGANISALAAIGNPTRLYGLGNGQLENGEPDAPNLYRINLDTGAAEIVGALGEPGEFSYNEAGLAFDSDGNLWAITDRRKIDNQPSQILSIDVESGAAEIVSTTSEVGFESLAIAPPTACVAAPLKDDGYRPIPTLSSYGILLTVFILMFAGMIVLRKRAL